LAFYGSNTSRNKVKFLPWQNIFEYPRALKSIEADICIAPLSQGIFNECKSNIKQLEFAACGATGVFSDIEPYKNATLKAKIDEEMISMVEELAGNIDLRAKVYKKDYERIGQQLFWEENNNLKKYVDTYLELFGKKI